MQPNILIIQTDDMGRADAACYGHPIHETPHIDHLAREGMRFTQANATSTICTPSRSALIAGQHPARSHITGQPGYRNDDQSERRLHHPPFATGFGDRPATGIGTHLAQTGYRAWLAGKWGIDDAPESMGFTTLPAKSNREITDAASSFLTSDSAAAPFLLYVNFSWPHVPLKADERDIAHFRSKIEPGQPYNPTYAAVIACIDQAVGAILDSLETGPADAENTIVVFTSDHGGYLGFGPCARVTFNEPLKEGKASLYEGGLRVPFIVRWPGKIAASSVCDEPVSVHLDLHATLANLVDSASIDTPIDGTDLGPLLTGKVTTLPDRPLFWHWPHYRRSFAGPQAAPSSAVRDGDWKLIEFFEDGRVELYHLASDPGETRDLAAIHRHVAGRLRLQLAHWRQDVGAQLPLPNPDLAFPES